MTLPFHSDCTQWSQKDVDTLNVIIDQGEDISWKELKEHIPWTEFKEQIFCGRKLDPTVSYCKVPGWEIYYFSWSHIEHIFAKDSTIEQLKEKVEESVRKDEDFNVRENPQGRTASYKIVKFSSLVRSK